MTIQNTTVRKAGPSQGNGVTTVFPFTFKVFSNTDILVTYLNALGVESVLVLTTNYTVSLNANQNTSPGGSVTLLAAPATATYITLTSQVPNTQTLALTNSGGFYPESINNALDRTVIEIQQLAEKYSRALSLPASVSNSISSEIPSPIPLSVLAWNVNGTAIENVSLESSSSFVTYKSTATGAVTRTVSSKLGDEVSVLDFGADPTGATNSTTALQAAINSGAKQLNWPAGSFMVTAPLVPVANQSWVGVTGLTEIVSGANTYLLQTNGSISTDLTNTLASNVLKGNKTITLATGKGANFSVGNIVLVQSEAPFPYPRIAAAGPTKTGELWRIQAISGDTITFAGNLRYSYLTSDTALIRKINTIDNLSISNITFRCGNTDLYRRALTWFYYCSNLKLINVRVQDSMSPGIQLAGCYDTTVTNLHGYNMLSNSDISSGIAAYGYAIVELGANRGLNITSITADRCRHAYTTGPWATGPLAFLSYGTPMSSLISNGLSINALASGFDTHPDGDGITFNNCKTVGGQAAGFQIRSVNFNMFDCSAVDVVGEGIYVTPESVNGYISNVTLRNTNTGGYDEPGLISRIDRGCIFINSTSITINGAVIENCGGPAIEGFDGFRLGNFSNLNISNTCQLTTVNKSAILLNPNATTTAIINNSSIINSDTNMNYGINCNTNVVLNSKNGYILGQQTNKYNYTAGFVESNGINTKSMGKATFPIFIVSGVLDITNSDNPNIIPGGEGSVADTLDVITGGSDGDIIYLTKGSQTITITHSATLPNNILLASKANKILNSFVIIQLIKRGLYWVEAGASS